MERNDKPTALNWLIKNSKPHSGDTEHPFVGDPKIFVRFAPGHFPEHRKLPDYDPYLEFVMANPMNRGLSLAFKKCLAKAHKGDTNETA